MPDYWEALIKGLTPQTKFGAQMWWKMPIVLFAIILLASVIL